MRIVCQALPLMSISPAMAFQAPRHFEDNLATRTLGTVRLDLYDVCRGITPPGAWARGMHGVG